MDKKLQTYEAPGIVVSFDPNVCRHSGVCVRGLPGVFDAKSRPWIRPESASPEAVAEQVRLCPSGALQFRMVEGEGSD